jgi:opacity protein-like surface antigen
MGVGRFVPLIAAVLAMAVSGCAIIVVDQRGNEREIDSLYDIRPGETIKDVRARTLHIDYNSPLLNRYGPQFDTNPYAAGTTRYIVGAELGISNFHAETGHFLPAANVSGSSAGVTGTLFAGNHYAIAHNPTNMVTDWLRGEVALTFGDMSVRTNPNFGNESLASHLRYRADFSLGYSRQFHKNQSRATDICLFLLGGPSLGKIEYDFAGFSGSKNQWGWHIGGGVEIQFAPNWVIRGEVRHANLGKSNIGPGIDVEHEDTSFRLGIGFRQNYGAPPPP